MVQKLAEIKSICW